ncbi:homeobox-domain-containing protein [Heliocybe sulcata]|uniref:Homeobox-domain-containing protein n=1 Tax=Heliocybe sulcata TaxID=5364 RepID=A0A5C3N8M6_9AGAM|nr:homeobox-domain-containing protein [Heliocybe sulcata]
MADQHHNYLFDSFSRPSRAGTPSGGFSSMGQGGRTNLPPLHTALQTLPPPVTNAYPTYYNQQQQPTQGRNDYNTSVYGQGTWPSNTATSQYHQSSSYGVYQDPRHTSQSSYSSYPSRSSPAPLPTPTDSLRLPPINVPAQNSRDERWTTQQQYSSMPAHHSSQNGGPYQGHHTPHHSSHTATNVRSPTAPFSDPYGSHYTAYQSASYGHAEAPDPRQLPGAVPPVNTPSRMAMAAPRISTVGRGVPRPDMHGFNPYPPQARASIPAPANYLPEPETPVTESSIKKKRKRADAAQLKVLNDVYARTAFPSTEERQELAKKLDMSARSVQIWFQNKRQAMRQSNRQTGAATTTHESTAHSHTHTSHIPVESPVSPAGGYAGSPTPPIGSSSRAMPSASYMSRPPESVSFHSMGRSPQSTPAPRRMQSPDEHSGKWSSRYQ